MIFDLIHLKEKYNLNFKGVVHVGAHHGQENELYKQLNIENRVFFEPVSFTFDILKRNVPESSTTLLVNKAAGNENKKIIINTETANAGQSSSILNLKLHLEQYPGILFNGSEEVDMVRLDDFIVEKQNYNFLNIDVQGYELEVLKGSQVLLDNIDFIITEINRAEVYENCAQVEDIISFLQLYGFRLAEENWMGGNWGDGFFIKG